MKRIAIIIARGGSKRIPRKNIRPFHGKPMIHHAIATAKASKLFDQVLVSTDDSEIATVAMLGACAGVIKRPAELADDYATTAQVMKHAVTEIRSGGLTGSELTELEHVCCIYPCSPLMLAADLHAGYNKIMEAKKSYTFPVAEYSPAPQRALQIWPDGAVRPAAPRFREVRTQDLEPRYYDAGQWYWGTVNAWLNEVPIHDSWSAGIKIPRLRAIDIDTFEDWQLAEAVYQMQFNHREDARGT